MLPGRNPEALQNIGLKKVNREGEDKQTQRKRERMSEGKKMRRNTKRREHREASRGGGWSGEGEKEGGGEKAKKSENEYGLTRVWFMEPRRRGSPFAVERCSYPEIMSGLHLLHPWTSSFFGCWCRLLTVVQCVAYFPSLIDHSYYIKREVILKRCNELIGDFNDCYQRVPVCYAHKIFWIDI